MKNIYKTFLTAVILNLIENLGLLLFFKVPITSGSIIELAGFSVVLVFILKLIGVVKHD